MRHLSKSKILACRQCPKRLWLEIHKPELRDDSASAASFAIGHHVGDVARQVYDPQGLGTVIDIGALGHAAALELSATLLVEGSTAIFEAGLTAAGGLAYADVMLPDHTDAALRWKMIEVKSSTTVKDYHRDDIAIQTYIASAAGIQLSSISLAHVDNTFVYPGGGDYQGLLKENDLTAEAISRHDEVKEWIAQAQEVAALPEEPEIATGPQCITPFTCGFCDYCHREKVTPEFPLTSLPNLHHSKRKKMEAAGHDDLRDVPNELLGVLQHRVKQCSITGEAYFDAAGAAADLADYGFPAYFLDFETSMLPVPIWQGTKPYQQIPFQFSLHILTETGELQHHSFLDLCGDDPSYACAKSLCELCGKQGPVFAYNAGFEKRVMNELAKRFPEFATDVKAIITRVVDLLPITRNRYYHPSQHGSWSIKAVLPAICPDLSYDSLDGVQDGGMAASAFTEAISPATTPARKEEIRQQLHDYCKLDTLALVRIWQKFHNASPEDSASRLSRQTGF
jgi:hypothetical protein